MIEICVFFCQVVRIVLGIEFSTGHLKQGGGLVEPCVTVNVLVEPSFDLCQVSLGDAGPDIAGFRLHGGEHLRTVCAAQGVGWEVTDAAAGPMGVLQAALPVVGNLDA